MRFQPRGLAVAALALVLAACAGRRDLEKQFGYSSVAATFAALEARSDAKLLSRDGWTMIEDSASSTLWTFAPPDHPAYPAVIRRHIVERDGRRFVEMSALCEGPREACDKLIAEMRPGPKMPAPEPPPESTPETPETPAAP
jgi:hypothetical protein